MRPLTDAEPVESYPNAGIPALDGDDTALRDRALYRFTQRITEMDATDRQDYAVLYDMVPSLLGQTYLAPHDRLYHFRGSAQLSRNTSTTKRDRFERDGEHTDITYRRITADEVTVEYGSRNPYEVDSYITQDELQSLVSSNTNFDDLVIHERGRIIQTPPAVLERLTATFDDQITGDDDVPDLSTMYPHETGTGTMLNNSRMGFRTFDVGDHARSVLDDDVSVGADDRSTISPKIKSVLKTDYVLSGGGIDHRHLSSIDELRTLVDHLAANNRWQDTGVPMRGTLGEQELQWYRLNKLNGDVIL